MEHTFAKQSLRAAHGRIGVVQQALNLGLLLATFLLLALAVDVVLSTSSHAQGAPAAKKARNSANSVPPRVQPTTPDTKPTPGAPAVQTADPAPQSVRSNPAISKEEIGTLL